MVIKMKNTVISIIIFCFALALAISLAPTASALGVSPGMATVNYVPNAEVDIPICFLINQIPKLQVEISGNWENYTKIKGLDPSGILDTRLQSNCVTYHVKMPPVYDVPGKTRLWISATEVPDKPLEGNIVALVKIIHFMEINVPYPGKYVELTHFSGQNVNAGEIVPFEVQATNRGVQTINFMKGEITIYDNQGQKIADLTTNTISNLPNEGGAVLKTNWNSSPNREGNYQAKLKLTYDEFNTNATVAFKLGALDIQLYNYTSEVIIGGYKPFYLVVESLWSEAIKIVKANIYVYNGTSNVPFQQIETITKDIIPWGYAGLEGHFDTSLLGIGEYNIVMNVTFDDQIKSFPGKLKIIPVPKVEEPMQWNKIFSTTNLLIGMVVLLLIVIVIVVVAMLPKKKEAQDTKNPPKV
jgi:hypothetical protein